MRLPETVLDPVERVSEILFGLIMVLTFTSTIRALSDHATLGTILWSALGCNVAWGIIDAGLYLLGCLAERGRNLRLLRAVRTAAPEQGQRLVADALPEDLGRVLTPEEVEALRSGLARVTPPPGRARLTRGDWTGAAGVCLLVILSTFPVVLPFLFFSDVTFALRVSNGVAVASMFVCGVLFARYAGLPQLLTGAAMAVFGVAMVAIAITLGG